MNNKIIEVQEILFNEMKRIEKTTNVDTKETRLEFDRATALYNMSTGFIKSLNANITIMDMAKRNGGKYEDLMKKLGL